MTLAKFTQIAVVIAGTLAGAVVLPGQSMAGGAPGRYEIGVNGNAAWRLDTRTGHLTWCEAVAVTPTAPITPLGAPAAEGVKPPVVIYGDTSRRKVECFDKDGRVDDTLF